MDILKIVFLGILTTLLYALLRQLKPETAPLVVLAGAAVIIIALTDGLLGISEEIDAMMELAGLEKGECFNSDEIAGYLCCDAVCRRYML